MTTAPKVATTPTPATPNATAVVAVGKPVAPKKTALRAKVVNAAKSAIVKPKATVSKSSP